MKMIHFKRALALMLALCMCLPLITLPTAAATSDYVVEENFSNSSWTFSKAGATGVSVTNEKLVVPFRTDTISNHDKHNYFTIPSLSATTTPYLSLAADFTFDTTSYADYAELRCYSPKFESSTVTSVGKVTSYGIATNTGSITVNDSYLETQVTAANSLKLVQIGATRARYMNAKGVYDMYGAVTYDATKGVHVEIVLDLVNGYFASYINDQLDIMAPLYAQVSVQHYATADATSKSGVWCYGTVKNITLTTNNFGLVHTVDSSSNIARNCTIDNLCIKALATPAATDTKVPVAGDITYNESFESGTLGDILVSYPSTAEIVDGALKIDFDKDTTDAWVLDPSTGWSAGSNIDVGAYMKGFSAYYRATPTVVMEAEYTVEKGSKGKIVSQLAQVWPWDPALTGSVTATQSNKRMISLYTVDAGAETLTAGGKTVDFLQGQKNKVTLVLNLASGSFDVYLNNVYVGTTSLGYGNLTLNTDNWIVGKVMKVDKSIDDGDQDKCLAGSFSIDNVKMTIPTGEEAVTYTASSDANALYTKVIIDDVNHYVTNGSIQVWKDANTVVTASSATMALPETLDLGSVRLGDQVGLRFVTEIDAEALKALHNEGCVRDIQIGTLIAPADYVTKAGEEATFEALGAALPDKISYLDVVATEGAWYTPTAGVSLGNYSVTGKLYAGSIVNMKTNNLERDMVGRGYVKVTFVDGTYKYFYSVTKAKKNVATIADAALKETGITWTTAQKAQLNDLIGTVTEVDTIGTISDVVYNNSSYIFRLANGIYCRLSHQGSGGWRLQSTKVGGTLSDFQNTGAVQALSLYVGDQDTLGNSVLTMDDSVAGAIKLIAPDGSYALIHTETGAANLISFFSADGTISKSISSIIEANGVATVVGDLKANTGIYGGGEKFDTVNQRGKTIDLFAFDGWNDDSSTYIAIPFFVTSDGCGLFMNRYERMNFTFSATSGTTWSAELQNAGIDLYVNVTGSMTDALLGYADLAGHASLPSEWAQGVMICRYSSDFSTFDTDAANKTNKDGAPSGLSVKTIVTNFINAGMKPDAVILEPWNWNNISSNNSTANQKEAELQQTIDWLQSQGIRTMLYLQLGFVSAAMEGYSDSYLVTANMHKWQNGSISNTQRVVDIPRIAFDGQNPDAKGTTTFRYLDITNPKAWDWYINTIWGQLIEMGVDGVKIDFCEDLPDSGQHYDFNIKKSDGTTYLSGDYTVTYNWKDPSYFDEGTEHHSYSSMYITSFYQKMNELIGSGDVSNDFVVLSRGGGIGMHRNPYMWGGDQTREFESLGNQLIAVLSTGMSGMPFVTYDMGGYRYGSISYKNMTVEMESRIFARAVEYTAFTTNIQTHGTVRHAYQMTQETQTIYKNYVALHDELGDYIYKLSEEACETGVPVVRPLVLFAPNDTKVFDIQDEFMLGDAILVAPILTDNTNSRTVYLPAGKWKNMLTGETVTGGKSVTVNANLGQIPVFLNVDSEDYDTVKKVFDGKTWRKIKSFTVN